MLGCDYCESIRGIGPKRAIELVTQFKTIEEIIKNIDTKKYNVPEGWNYKAARALFIDPEVADPESIEVTTITAGHFCNTFFLYFFFFYILPS